MNFLEVYPNALSKDKCDSIIKLFEQDDRKEPGRIASGVDTDNKVSTDLLCNFIDKDFKEYNDIILESIGITIALYRQKYHFLEFCDTWNISGEYNIQRYNDGDGFFKPHCEQGGYVPYRMLAWMIYLTDSLSGTEFPYQNTILEAKRGNMAVWPAAWTHPHKGQTPNRGHKYIITGWGHFVDPFKPVEEVSQ